PLFIHFAVDSSGDVMRQKYPANISVVRQVHLYLNGLGRRLTLELLPSLLLGFPCLCGWIPVAARRRCLHPHNHAWLHPSIAEHQRPVTLLIQEQAHRKVVGAFDVDDVCFPFFCLSFTAIAEVDCLCWRSVQKPADDVSSELRANRSQLCLRILLAARTI